MKALIYGLAYPVVTLILLKTAKPDTWLSLSKTDLVLCMVAMLAGAHIGNLTLSLDALAKAHDALADAHDRLARKVHGRGD